MIESSYFPECCEPMRSQPKDAREQLIEPTEWFSLNVSLVLAVAPAVPRHVVAEWIDGRLCLGISRAP